MTEYSVRFEFAEAQRRHGFHSDAIHAAMVEAESFACDIRKKDNCQTDVDGIARKFRDNAYVADQEYLDAVNDLRAKFNADLEMLIASYIPQIRKLRDEYVDKANKDAGELTSKVMDILL